MGSDNNRNIGLSEIIRMLENNVTFTQAADSVLECITDSMDVCDAVVMHIDTEIVLKMNQARLNGQSLYYVQTQLRLPTKEMRIQHRKGFWTDLE